MDQAVFYGLFFTGIVFNYAVKLHLENRGGKLERSNIRDGIIMGVSGIPSLPDRGIPRHPEPRQDH